MKSNRNHSKRERITTALLLAAGTGSRLRPLTQNAPKCLTMVNDISILERLMSSLNQHGFKRLVVITGHLEDHIRRFLGNQVGNVKIEYVFSPLFKTTNNIYSLWMARKIIRESFLLIESDLVFDPALLTDMLYPDRIAVARMKPWLNGSTVTIKNSGKVNAFHIDEINASDEVRYKTVNIYSLSLESWQRVIKKLDQYVSEGKVNTYYETVFRQMVAEKNLSFKAVFFDSKPWYEIDTMADLTAAEKIFPSKIRKSVPFGNINIPILSDTLLNVSKPALKGVLHATS
jgi:choline kinase